MKVAQKDLLKALETVGSVVSPRPTLPILGNVLLDAKKDALTLRATDLEVGIELKMDAKAKNEGRLTVPAKKLLDVVREMPDGEISLEFDTAARMKLSAGSCEIKILGLPPDEFPQSPEIKRVADIKVDGAALVEMVQKTLFSVSADETRYVLNGALMVWEKGTLKLITTDGRRLAYIERELKAAGGKVEAIIPTKALQVVTGLLGGNGTEVHMLVGEGYARFSAGAMELTTRLIDGNFPDYEQVIPKAQDKKVVADTGVLLSAVKRASLMAMDRSNGVKLDLKSGGVTLSSASHEIGEAREEVPLKYEGESLSVGYNAKFLIDVLKNMPSKEVSLELSTPLAPGLFRPVGKEYETYKCVVMPIRL